MSVVLLSAPPGVPRTTEQPQPQYQCRLCCRTMRMSPVPLKSHTRTNPHVRHSSPFRTAREMMADFIARWPSGASGLLWCACARCTDLRQGKEPLILRAMPSLSDTHYDTEIFRHVWICSTTNSFSLKQ
ncbi:hypothetical protein FIBSPDRAFT_151472 [Athelia psychrophila]|uniref:Uncharacterized protein n=1 Tax=Athelia psychrophila TaxID=1759441 RepID=A0A166BNI9_9AGAM|nr:hypothetical protein FIBSPDRAFT_151472 [Fibularhizoctonia sp. CBS 109695]